LQEKALNVLLKNFPNLNKNLNDIENFFDLSYEAFLNFITQDGLVMETEREISELILNYIKSRRNISENFVPPQKEINNENEINKFPSKIKDIEEDKKKENDDESLEDEEKKEKDNEIENMEDEEKLDKDKEEKDAEDFEDEEKKDESKEESDDDKESISNF